MKAWGETQVGRVRENNEDSYKIDFSNDKKTVLAVVCDGMGGARAGQVASEMACDIFTETVMERPGEHSGKKLEALMK